VAKNIEKLLARAQKAYQKRDKQKGASLIDQILQQDYLHAETWELLHKLYAPNQPLEEFQRTFTETYYPEKLPLLQPRVQAQPLSRSGGKLTTETTPAPPKPSFFARIFGIFKHKPKPAKPPLDVPTTATPPATAGMELPADQHQHLPAFTPPVSPEFPPTPPSEQPTQLPSSPSLNSASQPVAAVPSLSQSQLAASPQPHSASIPQPVHPATSSAKTSDKIRVLVVDDIQQTRANVVRALRFQDAFEVVGTASNGEQGLQLALELQPDVIIMDVNMPGMDGIATTGIIKRELPTTEIIIMTVQDDVDYMRGAMTAGARDFLAKPPMVDDLIQAVKRAGAIALETKAALRPAIEKQAAVFPIVQGKIISVYSPRGGTGCTTLAVNLAAALHTPETPVVIVDGSLQFGDIPVFFNTQSRFTIFDLATRSEELDPDIIEEVLVQHTSGIHILAPPRPEEAETINSLQFTQVLKYLSGLYPYVIVDTTHRLTDTTLAALDIGHVTLIVTTQDIPAIARLRQFLDLAPALGLDQTNTLMVINHYDPRAGVNAEKIGQALKRKIAAVIPEDKATAIPAMNRGVPFMLQNESLSRPAARVIAELKTTVIQQLELLDQKEKEKEAEETSKAEKR
jgi:pilus assembly protein CpaE